MPPMYYRPLVAVLVGALLACGTVLAAERSIPGAAQPEQKSPKKKVRTGDTPFGREGDARKVKRVIRIDMSDTMQYFPDQIRVNRGDTIRFLVRNSGQLPHEMVLGTMDDLKKRAVVTKRSGGMNHDDANVAQVAPGGTGRIVWQFTKAGEFYYGCLVPGHFDAGMIGTVVVR